MRKSVTALYSNNVENDRKKATNAYQLGDILGNGFPCMGEGMDPHLRVRVKSDEGLHLNKTIDLCSLLSTFSTKSKSQSSRLLRITG